MSRNPDLTFFIHTQNTPLTDCATAGLCIESANVVGYQAKSVTANTRAIRSAATFLLVGENPTAIKLSDIKQTAGEPGDLTLCTYNDNVTRLAQYICVSAEAAAEAEIDPGWYILDGDGNPDVEAGVKEAGHLHPGLVGPVQSLPPPPLQSEDAEADAAPGRQLQGRVRAGGRRQTIGAKRMHEIGHGTRDEFAETQARLIYGDPPEAGRKTEEVTSC